MNTVISVMLVSFFTNILLALIKIIVGFIGKSSALIADGVHSFSDLTTDIIAIVGSKISDKPADDKHPFGHGKLEYLTSFFIGLIVILLGLFIIKDVFNKEIIVTSAIVIIVSIITIISKLLLSSYLIIKGKKLNNTIVISSGKESRADVLSSIVVLLSAILIQLSNKIEFLKYADVVATIIVAILIIRVGFNIIKENISNLLGESETDEIIINKIKEQILKIDNVYDIENLNVIKYGSYYKLSCEVSINKDLSFIDAHDVVHKIEKNLKKMDNRIKYVLIHANPSKSSN